MHTPSSTQFPDIPSWAWIGIPVIAWFLAWAVQLNFPIFDYAPGVALVFLPAGVRTLAVLVFGWRGAVGVAIGTLITYLWFFDDIQSSGNIALGILLALASGFSAYFMFRLVQWWQDIPGDLSCLRLKHIITIVVSQGILSATLHQLVYHSFALSPFYAARSLEESLTNGLAMAVGDTLGSMLLLYAVAIVARWGLQRVTYSEPRS